MTIDLVVVVAVTLTIALAWAGALERDVDRSYRGGHRLPRAHLRRLRRNRADLRRVLRRSP